MIWRRTGRDIGGNNPDQVLVEARAALADLRNVLGEFRANLDELEQEVLRHSDEKEGYSPHA